MEWRGIAVKVLVFVMGAAGVVLAVFVVAPWLEVPDQPADHPPSRDAIVEGALASFGDVNAGEADGEAGEAVGVAGVPSPLLAAGGDNPVPGPVMDAPAVVPGNPDAAAAQDTGLPEVLSPQEAAVVTWEPVRVASAPHAEMGDGPLAVGPPMVEMERSAEPMPAAGKEAPPAPSAPEAVDVLVPIAAEPVPAEPVRDAQQLSGELSRETEAARQSSRAGLPRLEFEAPGGLQVVETPLGAEYPPAASKAPPPGEPLSEFSPRPFVHSVAPPAVETVPPSGGPAEAAANGAGLSDPVVVPGTLRGVMGYRMPLVSRQALPDQVVSGVLIPAHTTYVILQPGYWELVGLSPDEVNVLRAAAEAAKAAEAATRSEPLARGWKPFRMFRRNTTPANGE